MSDTQTNNRSRSTLSDVAQMAGVSASTVSAVLAGKGEGRRISEETHSRVHHAARTLNYSPSLLHRSIRKGRSHILSFYNALRNREENDLYLDRLSIGIERAGGRHEYDVLVHCNFGRTAQKTFDGLNGGISDGLVLYGPGSDDSLLTVLRASGLPTVLINPREREDTLASVYSDSESGMRMVAEALLAQGHRRVVSVAQASHPNDDPLRRAELLATAFVECGVEAPETVLFEGDPRATLLKALQGSNPPTALFVWHDRLAYRIVEACAEEGVRVPEDLSIVGYDGIVWPSASPHRVASVRVPIEEMASAAVALLHRLVEGEAGPSSQTLPVRFDLGTTLGPAAR